MIIEPNQGYRKIFPIIGMILLFIAGFLIAYFWMNAKVQKVAKDAAVKLAESQKKESALPQMPKIKAPAEFFSISGNVENIDGQKITLKSLSFGEQKTYIVTVGDDTKITKREMDLSPPKEGTTTPPAPKETEAKFADIRVGDNLMVDSADNISGKTEFIAKSIYIEIVTGLPTPPPMPAMPDASSIPAPPAMPGGGTTTAPPAPAAPSSSGAPPLPATSAIPAPSAPNAPTSSPPAP